jgi:NADH:ubiquinone oxidoreductase subunit 5 (subunit L)/multisubunit Na+/H+ antiporter MnhA subunit
MQNEILLLSVILVPIFGAFILPLVGRISEGARNKLALLMVLWSLVGTVIVGIPVLNGHDITVSNLLGADYGLVLHADGLAVFMAFVSALISAIIVFYSWGYISHYDNRNEYYLMVVLFFGAMMGIVFSAHLIFLYLFWEITAITSWRLIGFFREPKYVLRADKAFLVTIFGALLMLLGFISIYNDYHTFNLSVLAGKHISSLAVMLILAGILSKSATLPFHTWLPDAGVAPSPVTALLHAALLVKIGVYVFARLFVATFSVDAFWHTAVPIIAAVSALVSAGAALIETDLKRIIAYSTVSQIGFIFLGLAVGNEMGVAGATLYIMMHGLAKGGLFLCAGIVEQNAKTKDITQMGGLLKTMPITAISFLLCAFSIMGVPPFGGFFCKLMVMTGAVDARHIWIALTFLVGAFMTIVYLLRTFNMVFMGEPQRQSNREGSSEMVISVATLAALSLLGGILIYAPSQFIQTTITQLPLPGITR